MNLKRLGTIFLWTLAVLLPGGLPALALWVSVRAARDRMLLRQARPQLVPVASPQS